MKSKIVIQEKYTKDDWMHIASCSYSKFVGDLEKTGDWDIYPTCDKCNMIYLHYYLKNDVWKKAKVKGWICPLCLIATSEVPIGKEDILQIWGNLFEVHTEPKILYEKLEKIISKQGGVKYIDILNVVYNDRGQWSEAPSLRR